MATVIALCVLGYAVAAAGHARLCVWYVARKWPSLPWGSDDTAFTLFMSLFWPASLPTLLVLVILLNRNKRPERKQGIFARWHAKDRRAPLEPSS